MLSKQIQDQIRKDAEDFYNNAEEGHDQDYYSGLIVGYKAGATAQAEKAQVLIEALQLWQTYDTRIHNLIDVAKFHMEGLQALSQYKSE